MSGETVIDRQPIVIAEIDQDFCTRSYGVAPCTAAIGVTGVRKCFNTRISCQDSDNYDLADESPPAGTGKLTVRFANNAENLPRDVTLIPSIIDIVTAPTELNIGGADRNMGALGRRASVTITFKDHPHHDRGIDPYATERDYDAFAQGTFWSKWLARNPYYQGRPMRVREGYIGQALGAMRVRHYIIERIEGPSGGRVKITAKDPIKLLEFVRSQAPVPTSARLATAIASDTGTRHEIISLSVEVAPASAGDDFSASGVVRIGSELFTFVNLGSDTLQLTERGLRLTDIGQHKIGDAVQEVLVVDNERVDVLIRRLLVDFCNMDSAFIDTAAWASEAELWSSSLIVSAWITEPTGVAELIGEILQQTLCYIWWDELNQQIRFKVLRPRIAQIDASPTAVNDNSHLISDSVVIKDLPTERLSRVVVYYDEINPTKGKQAANFARQIEKVDADAESALEYGERRILEIFARFLGNGSDANALSLAVRLVNRYRDTPKLISFAVDAKDRNISPADYLEFTHHAMVDFVGAAEARVIQVISAEDADPGHRRYLTARIAENDINGYGFIMENTANVYDAATASELADGCYIAPNSGVFDDGRAAYRII